MDIDTAEIRPVDLSMVVTKQDTAGWLVEMVKHFEDYPEIIVNGFIWSGIPGAYESLDESETDGERCETDEESNESETDDEYGNSETECEGFSGEQPIYWD